MPDPTPDAIREAFEDWYFRDIPRTAKGRERSGSGYTYMNVETQWRAFQAGAAWAAAHKEQDDDGK